MRAVLDRAETLRVMTLHCQRLRLWVNSQLRDLDATDDLIQTSLIAGMKAYDDHGVEYPKAFMSATLQNGIYTWIHNAAVAKRRTAQLTPDVTTSIAEPGLNPEEQVLANEREVALAALLHGLFGRLAIVDHELMERFYIRHESGPMICIEMDLSATQFRQRKSRACRKCESMGRDDLHALLIGNASNLSQTNRETYLSNVEKGRIAVRGRVTR
ncbi:MAG: hypothetical protein NVS9B4_00440 [Candidatus Acidiferrum sp.]